MSQPPQHPTSGPEFGYQPSAGRYSPPDEFSHPDYPNPQQTPTPPPPVQAQPQHPPYAQPAPAPYAQSMPMPVAYAQPPQKESRSPALGIVALFLVLVACVIGGVLTSRTIDLIYAISSMSSGTPGYRAVESELTTHLLLQILPASLGLISFVLGIIAASTRRGAAAGVFAIIISVLATGAIFLAFAFGLQNL
ncbi:hypothetical protein [Microlunatus sp. Y2014]|uniref:hypothetical protein n=1 Tax=Microlunatus sp. Y2014 TaxID=3418488 RepID=UPI003DA70710